MKLEAGMAILVGGDRVVNVSPELAEKFQHGDRLIVVRKTEEICTSPGAVHTLAARAVDGALDAFQALREATDQQITQFYTIFADNLSDESVWGAVHRRTSTTWRGQRLRAALPHDWSLMRRCGRI